MIRSIDPSSTHDAHRIAAPPAPLDERLLKRRYHETDRGFRVGQSRVGCVLVLLCMPLGVSLDWFVYPKAMGPLLASRILCDIAVVPVYLMLRIARGREWIGVLGFIWPLFPAVAISWMVYATQGVASPYYAGLNLVMIVACLLMPYTLWESLGVCLATLGAYLAASALHHGRALEAAGLVFNNVYFMAITALICVTASHYNTRRRLGEFRLGEELAERNQQLGDSYRQLAEHDKLKTEFFANLNHELRTPLTLILSPAEDLLNSPLGLPDRALEALGMIRQNGLRLLKLITDLLEIVRLEEGRLDLRSEALDLDLFVPATVDSVRHLAESKGLSLYAQGTGPLCVNADSGRMEKVLLNVLTNAIKFTRAGGVITTRWGSEGETAFIEVRDTGIGIAGKDLPFIFDRFRQADGSSTRQFQGMGIGLSLARDLVREHGGRMTADSVPDSGTTIRIELPAPRDLTPGVGNTSPPRSASPDDPIAALYYRADRNVDLATAVAAPATDQPGRATVLVVDDEPDMRRFLVSVIGAEHRMLQAADGPAGLAIARADHPDLALLDLMLPGMDGLELCKALKSDEATRGMKIVLLTARTDEQSKLTALRHGADDFLTKPFSTTEVKTRLSNLLRAAGLEEEVRRRNRDLEQTLKKLKETEVQLIQSEKMNALGKLSAGLLHEINNPLNYTFMALDLAREQGSNVPDLPETLKDIGEGMTRIRDVVTDLRAFAYPSKLSAIEPFSLDDALSSATRLAAHELNEITLVRQGTDREALGSKTQIVHVLMNLLINSAQATKAVEQDRPPQVCVRAAAREGRLAISVRDNGQGVNPKDLSRLMEPFFTTKDPGQGMGLGLSICHTIVTNHGGRILVASEQGTWTEVTFDLPLADQKEA
jgi:signal transduction histidine kinase